GLVIVPGCAGRRRGACWWSIAAGWRGARGLLGRIGDGRYRRGRPAFRSCDWLAINTHTRTDPRKKRRLRKRLLQEYRRVPSRLVRENAGDDVSMLGIKVRSLEAVRRQRDLSAASRAGLFFSRGMRDQRRIRCPPSLRCRPVAKKFLTQEYSELTSPSR